MKTQVKIMLFAILAILALFAGQSQAQNMGRYIVTIQGPVGNAVRGAGGQVIYEYSIIPAIAIEIPEAAVQGLSRNPNVIRIEPDAEVWALPNTPAGSTGKPTDKGKPKPPTPPSQKTPWGVVRIGADQAWTTFTGDGVKVAVLDTGIDTTHPDLVVWGGRNFINPRKSYKDDNGHGTHVAGIIAALNNDIGVVGVAPGAKLYAVKVLNAAGSGTIAGIIAGLEWCVNNEIDIVNMSLGTDSDIQAFHDACDAAADSILLVAAAGNDGTAGDSVDYPAAYGSVIAVAATDTDNQRASWSSYGDGYNDAEGYDDEVDYAAPGVSIYSTYLGGGYATMSGTSMAAPHVAGTLALMLEKGNDTIFITDLGSKDWDIYYGYGLVNAYRSVIGF